MYLSNYVENCDEKMEKNVKKLLTKNGNGIIIKLQII